MGDVEKLVGKNIQRLRLARGWTQERLAFEIDLTPRYIRMIEAGKKNFTIRVLANIATALGVEGKELFSQPDADGRGS